MFSKFTEEAQKTLLNAKIEMKKLKHPYVGSEHLLLAILSKKNDITKKLNNLGVDYNKFKDKILDMIGLGMDDNDWFLYTPLLKRVLESSILDSKDNNNSVITLDHIFISLLEEGEGIAIRILISMGVNIDVLYNDFFNKYQIKKSEKNKKLKIYDYGNDLVKQADNGLIDPVIGREKEINRLIEILCRRRKNNPLLIGDAGVGKSAVVEELARCISKSNVPDRLKNKKIVSVSMSSLVSGTKYRGEFEERINKIIKELETAKDIILFIDEIHTLIGAGGAEGAIDASNILKPALARGTIQVIGATTTDEYKKYIESDRALARRFQILNLEEPTEEKTIQILNDLSNIYEKHHNVKIDKNMITYIVKMSNKYIKDRKQPDKAIDILDEACAKVGLKVNSFDKKINLLTEQLNNTINKKKKLIMKENFSEATKLYLIEKQLESDINKLKHKNKNRNNCNHVLKKDIDEVLEYKGNVKVYNIKDHGKTLVNLKNNLKHEIIGQDEAIDVLVRGTKKIIYNYKTNSKPLSFLFVGNTGIGKTFLAKTYSKLLFGKDKLIKIDMSEYKDESSINKLIGSPAGYVGYNDKGNVFEKVINNPHCVILLDEIEKANTKVINLFLQILDEGVIKDSSGKDIYFDNTIIIMTSNAACNKNSLGFISSKEEKIESLKTYFSLEFLNRIGEIIQFNSLTLEDTKKIINNKLKDLINSYKENDINIKINKQTIDEIINKSNYKKFGARQIDKIIEDIIDEKVIDNVCEGNMIINL